MIIENQRFVRELPSRADATRRASGGRIKRRNSEVERIIIQLHNITKRVIAAIREDARSRSAVYRVFLARLVVDSTARNRSRLSWRVIHGQHS